MKHHRLVLACILGFFVVGCDSPPNLAPLGRFLSSGATPAQAVERLLPKGPQYFFVTKLVPGGAVVFFRELDPNPKTVTTGSSFVKHENFGWVAEGVSMGSGAVPQMPFTLDVSLIPELPDNLLFNGLALEPKTTAIQILFADGNAIREPTTNGLFGMLVPIDSVVCRIELRDMQGQLLYAYDVAHANEPTMFDVAMKKRAENECK